MKLTHALRTFLLGGTLLAATSTLYAADGTWNIDTTNGLWGTDTNWVSNTIADLSGFTANFTNNITGDRTVRLDSDRTLTSVVFGDSDTLSAGSWLLDNNGNAANNLILAGTTPGITVNTLGTGKTATISAIIQGSAGLVKSGAGTLILSGANTFTGDRAVTDGTLRGTVAGAFGAQGNAASITISSGATLNYGTDNMFGNHDSTASPTLIVNGGTVTNSGAFVNSMRNITLNGGTLTATGGNATFRSWDINGTVTSTLTSTISGSSGILLASGTPTNTNFDVQSGTLTVSAFLENGRSAAGAARATSLTKQGNGTLTLSGANTYTGNLTVDGGTLIGTVAGAFGSFASARTINVNSGGILDFRASATGHNSINMNLVINGGTVTNAVTNTFNGLNNVTLSGGTLTSTSGIAGGPHDWGAWHINGTVTSTGTSLIEGASTSGRHFRLNANANNTNFDVQSGTLTVSAPVKNGRLAASPFNERTSTLTKLGAGVMILSGANAYTGPTTVSDGTLALGASDVLPNSTAVSLGTAIFAVGASFTDTAGILDVTGSAAINLGDAVSKIAFADNGALLTWAGTLNITGTFVPGASVRFGTDASGLTTDQLNLITVNGSGTYTLDTAGYLIASSASGFDSWKTVNGAGLQTLSDDHDNDGVSNGIEYFLGGPNGTTTGFTPLPALIPAGLTFSITWNKGPGYIGTYGTHFQVETSATLDNPWILETVGVNVTDTPTSVTFTFPAGTKNFARLKVTGP